MLDLLVKTTKNPRRAMQKAGYYLMRKPFRGYCTICGNDSVMYKYGNNLKETYKCKICGSIARSRHLALVACELFGLSKALGEEVKYVDVPLKAGREAILGMGMPEWFADALTEYFKAYREGWDDLVTSDVPDLIGRPAKACPGTDSPTGIQDKPKQPVPRFQRKCRNCGKELPGAKPNRRFCYDCAEARQREAKKPSASRSRRRQSVLVTA